MNIRHMEESKTMKAFNAKLLDDQYPGCEQYIRRSDEYWACFVKHVSQTIYHPVTFVPIMQSKSCNTSLAPYNF